MGDAFEETHGGEWSNERMCGYLVEQMIEDDETLTPVCELIGEEKLAEIAEKLADEHGGEWSEEDVCNYIKLLILAGADTDPYFP
jgi:hypothetical protein